MYYNSNKRLLYQYIDQLRHSLGVSYSAYPLDIVDLCQARKNIVVDHYPFNADGLCGIAMLGDKSDTIVLNANRSAREQNFDCGHEVIHTSKHRDVGADCFECFTIPKPEQNPILEWEANEGSAELLVPYKIFLPKVNSVYSHLTSWRDLKCLKADLALEFGVSMTVIHYRLENLKCELVQYNNGVPLGQIVLMSHAEQLNRNLHVLSLNDKFHNAS